jgi:16S rRNA (guanine966-N2)-methyltransferase
MRITGGRWRSRALETPRGMTTRPTSDRVREALFSMLIADGHLGEEAGPRVLDLYAGSGALAFEALSRGASEAVLVEQGRDALAAIRANARALTAERLVRVVAGKVDRALDKLDGPFGVVFADPPYADVRTAGFAGILAGAARLVAPGGALVLEHASVDAPPEVLGPALDRSRRHGDTTLTLYVRVSNPAPDEDPGRDAL